MIMFAKKHRFLFVMVSLLFCTAWVVAQETDMPVSLPGQIAYIGSDYNLYVVDEKSGLENTPLAMTWDGSEVRRYQWPTWSTDGRLAYFCCEPVIINDEAPLLLQTFVSVDGQAPGKLLYEAQGEAFTYGAWSPENCGTGETCRDLALLVIQTRQPFKVEVIRDAGDASSQRTIGSGAPFYFSWSPDGTGMVWQRNNRVLSLYDVQDDSVADLPELAGAFPAPAWSPVDNRVVVAARGDAENVSSTLALIDVDNGDRLSLKDEIIGVVAFNWSPDGRYIAYRQVLRSGFGHLNVIDAETGESIIMSSDGGVVGFLWSPDSTKIAIFSSVAGLGRQSAQDDRVLTLLWSVLDMETGVIRPVARFVPSAEMGYYLAYFDQFAQSHQLWSSDSRYLVYGELTPDDNGTLAPKVTVLDMGAEGAVPFHIADGRIGIWSYD